MSTPPSPNDLTRQQLDELDSLLQRMLSLPLSGPPEDVPPPPAPAPTGWRADSGTSAVKLPHLVADPAAVAAPVAVAESRAEAEPQWGPDPLARYAPPAAGDRPFGPPTPETGVPPSAGSAYQYSLPIPAPTGTLRGVDAPALPAGFRSLLAEAEAEADLPYPPTPTPTAPPPAPLPVTAESGPSLPVYLWPVVALNWVLETLLGLLGPVGAALTRPAVKHLLGVAGLLLLAGAGLWAARGMGWVHFDLPWPR